MMTVCIIPARGGSQRIPRKNIRLFHGKPIMAYSIETALRSALFDIVAVSTEDEEIGHIAASYGAAWLLRAAPDAEDEVGTQAVMQRALLTLDDAKLDSMRYVPPFAYACCIYATAPMLAPETLCRAYEQLRASGKDYVVPVAHWLQDPAQFYFGRAAAFRNEVPLLEAGTLLMPIDPRTACDINTMADWSRAENMYATLKGISHEIQA
jgi:N-acylneuraminate cytidylyltransferase